MKHITPILALSTLAAASAVAQSSPAKGNGLVYDRIGVGYAQNDTTDGLNGSFTALLGSHILVGGAYSDLDGRKDFSGVSGNGSSFSLGAKFEVGPGDLIIAYTYTQIQLSGVDEGLGLAAGLNGDTDTFSATYRMALNSSIEFAVGVSRLSGDADYAVIDFTDSPPTVPLADTVDFSDTAGTVSVRFNLTKQFDVTLGYTFADDNTWSISAGYNF
jgi:hypothetical protein